MKEQPLAGFIDDPYAGQQQQASFQKGGETFDLAVPVLVLGIGGFVGDAYREVGDGCRYQVESRVGGFGENAQTAGPDPNHNLHQSDGDGSKNGVKGNRLLLPLHAGRAGGVRHIVRLFTLCWKSANRKHLRTR